MASEKLMIDFGTDPFSALLPLEPRMTSVGEMIIDDFANEMFRTLAMNDLNNHTDLESSLAKQVLSRDR